MTVPADTKGPAGLLGWTHFQQALAGTKLLPAIGKGPGATGFSGSLPAGSYTFWLQDNCETDLAFDFNFEVSAVPEPAPAALLAAGATLLCWPRRRRARSSARRWLPAGGRMSHDTATQRARGDRSRQVAGLLWCRGRLG